MTPEPYTCALDPKTEKKLKIYLMKDVKNVDTIRSNVIKGSWKCAVIKPSLILDVLQIAVAANKAVLSERSNTMVTKTVYSEILYNLSLTKNISQSLMKFGVEKDINVLVCFLVSETDECEDIINRIEGESCPLSDLNKFTNLKEVKTVYKLNNFKTDVDLLDIIVSRMVTKSFVSH